MPEELAFEKIFGNRGAIDRHKGAVLTRTEVMNQTGEEFLACAAFAEEKHGRRPGGHFLRFFLRLHQQRATTHEFRCPALQKLFLQKNILGHELARLERLADGQQKMFRVHRFLQKIKCPLFDRFHGRFNRPMCRHHNDGNHGVFILDGLQYFETRFIRQLEIRQDEIHLVLPECFKPCPSILGQDDGMAFDLHVPSQDLGHAFIIFDEKDRPHCCSSCFADPYATGK